MPQRKIFISHSSDWPYINDFEELIRQLGYDPVVVEKKPSLGMDPGKKSRHYLVSSDLVVFVITKDAVDSSGKPHPKSNVAIEIGLAQEAKKKQVFIVEAGARPPSMVTKTYISVEEGNYYRAIADLIREIVSALPRGANLEASESPDQIKKLDKVEKRIIEELSKDAYGSAARPELLDLLGSELRIDEQAFNIARAQLRRKEIIVEGEIAGGHEYEGELYLMLTSRGWELAKLLR